MGDRAPRHPTGPAAGSAAAGRASQRTARRAAEQRRCRQVFRQAIRDARAAGAHAISMQNGALHRVCERYQENTVQLLNRNNKQTIGVVNKQKTNSWVLNKQLAWSSHRGLQKPFLMSVWTKFGYLSAPVMTIIHKKTKKLPQKAKKRRFTFSKQRRKFLTTFPLRRLCAAPANFCPKPHARVRAARATAEAVPAIGRGGRSLD